MFKQLLGCMKHSQAGIATNLVSRPTATLFKEITHFTGKFEEGTNDLEFTVAVSHAKTLQMTQFLGESGQVKTAQIISTCIHTA